MAQQIEKLSRAVRPFLVLAAVLPATAFAQTAAQSASVIECGSIADPTLRLECYDALFAVDAPKLSTDTAVTPIATKPAAEPVAITTEAFGRRESKNDLIRPVETPAEKRKAAKAKAEKITALSERVSKIDIFGYKKMRITLANGQVWEQIGSVTRRPPKLSSKRPLIAEIREAALGSYALQFDGKGREVKVKRVR